MPKFGNSSTNERIELIHCFIDLLEIDSIDCPLADSEKELTLIDDKKYS